MSLEKKGNGENVRSVRFAEASTVNIVDTTGSSNSMDTSNLHNDDHRQSKKRKLDTKKVVRMNDDELDDVDEWNPDEDDDNDNDDGVDATKISVNERELLEAKRQRRTKRVVGDNDEDADTRIDNRTSLAAEGYEIEPFHMDQERNDGGGYFEGDTYIFRKRNSDEDGEPDAWVDSLNDKSTKNVDAKDNVNSDTRHERIAMLREERRRQQIAEDADDRMDNWSEDDLYTKLLPHLEGENETVMGALIRYGQIFQLKQSNKSSSSNIRGRKDASNNTNVESRKIAQDTFNIVTEAANALLLKGKIDIYDAKKIDIEALVSKPRLQPGATTDVPVVESAETAVASLNHTTDVKWEYQGNQDGQIQGPFSTAEMLGWMNAGYFLGSMAVQVRTISTHQQLSSTSDKSIKDDLLSDLLNDDDDDNNQAPNPPFVQRGEWILSDKVDFHKYVR